MRLPTLLRSSAIFVCLASYACAQKPAASQLQKICDVHHESERCLILAQEFYTDHGLLAASPYASLDNPLADTQAFADKLAPSALALELESSLKAEAEQAAQSALQTIATTAAVTQVGGSSSANGSTNLIAKPTTTDFLSAAAESGAFTDTVNGTTATLQANALGLTKYFANLPVFERVQQRLADLVQPLNFSVTLNVAQSSATNAPTTGSATTLTPAGIASVLLPSNNASFSGFGMTYNVYRRYSPQDKNFATNWKVAVLQNQTALNTAGSAIAVAINNLLLTSGKLQTIAQNLTTQRDAWHLEGAAAERSGNFDSFVAAYAVYDTAFADYIFTGPDTPKNLLALSAALTAFNASTYTVLNQARGTPLATLGYTYATPVQKPSTHDFTAIGAYLFKGSPNLTTGRGTFLSGAEFTFNAGVSIYGSIPAGATYGRLRDVQLSSEFDKPFGGTIAAPRGTVSLAGYGQYQFDPTVLNITPGNLAPGTNITLPSDAQVLLGTAGWLGVVQGKLVFNLSNGLTLPVALKWSNKTDLLAGNDVRGQIGLSYDLSALSSLIKPSH